MNMFQYLNMMVVDAVETTVWIVSIAVVAIFGSLFVGQIVEWCGGNAWFGGGVMFVACVLVMQNTSKKTLLLKVLPICLAWPHFAIWLYS